MSDIATTHNYYRNMFEKIPIGISIVSLNGYIILMNDAMMKITGWSKEDMGKFDVRNYYLNPEDKKKIDALIEQEGEVEGYELPLLRKDNSCYWALITIKYIEYKGEKCFLITQMDISEKKRIQKELEEKESQLQESSIISMISTIFINDSQDFFDKFQKSIKIFGNALKADAVIIFRCKNQPNRINLHNGNSLIDVYWKKPNNFNISKVLKERIHELLEPIVKDFCLHIPQNFYKIIKTADNRALKEKINKMRELNEGEDNFNIGTLLLFPLFLPISEKERRNYGVIVILDKNINKKYKRSEIHMGFEMSVIFALAIKNRL